MNDLLDLIHQAPKPTKTICFDPNVKTYVETVLFPHVIRYNLKDAGEYCLRRDLIQDVLLAIKSQAEQELKIIFSNHPEITVLLMSSFGSNTFLIGGSDIDFGIIIKNLNETTLSEATQLLTRNEYAYKGRFHTYESYEKEIQGIEIEAKVRDADESMETIELHHFLDNLDDQTQKIITYLKYVAHADPALYGLAKSLVYSWAFTLMKNL